MAGCGNHGNVIRRTSHHYLRSRPSGHWRLGRTREPRRESEGAQDNQRVVQYRCVSGAGHRDTREGRCRLYTRTWHPELGSRNQQGVRPPRVQDTQVSSRSVQCLQSLEPYWGEHFVGEHWFRDGDRQDDAANCATESGTYVLILESERTAACA
jgi:hypothetical protein